jgi:signal transduction histidine kinase
MKSLSEYSGRLNHHFLFFTPFLLFLGLMASPVFEQSQAAEHAIILDGIHKFSPDDNPAFSSADYNDTQWQQIKIPGSWQSQGIKSARGIGWYRIHCVIPDAFRNIDPAILLGRIGDADEVFLNGLKIGGEGLISKQFVEASKIQRLYKVPREDIRFNSDNVIAVRVLNTYLNGGIFDSGVKIGDYRDLLLERSKRYEETLIWEFCFFTVFALFFLSCLFFYIKGLRDREYFYFWFFITLYGALFFIGSVTFYNTGLKTRLVQQVINATSAFLPASLLLLLLHFYKEKFTVYMKGMSVSFIGIALMTTFFYNYTARIYLYTLWKILFILTASFLAFVAVKASVRKFYESGTILLGIIGLIAGFILESLGGIDLLYMTGFFLWDYATVFFMICVMYALTSRYTRIKELQSASVKIFDAHEEERKRLARELHDGIGTSLLATKMKLQMLEAQVKNKVPMDKQAFPELISEINLSIEELRAVSMDLRPSFLENTELVEAIKWHAKKVKERSGVEVNVSAGDIGQISLKIKENFYRIFQEALNNAVKHSGANRVEVLLSRDKSYLVLEIQDNGKGFHQPSIEDEQGIGLYTIRERVELLSGIIRITSSDRIGTDIFIEVPVQ